MSFQRLSTSRCPGEGKGRRPGVRVWGGSLQCTSAPGRRCRARPSLARASRPAPPRLPPRAPPLIPPPLSPSPLLPRDVPNYHSVIKQPRCLEGIERKLAQGRYHTPSSLLADVALVWENCRTYNEPDAPVVAEAASSEAAFKQYWRVRVWLLPLLLMQQRQRGLAVLLLLLAAAADGVAGGGWVARRACLAHAPPAHARDYVACCTGRSD